MAEFHPVHWFEHAEDLLDSAQILYEIGPKKYPLVCFLCHQIVEKLLKAFIIFNTYEYVIFAHDLIDLCVKCIYFDESFENIRLECHRLNLYFIEPRYPTEKEYTEYITNKVLIDAKNIFNFKPIAATFVAAKADYENNYIKKSFNGTTKLKNNNIKDD